MVGLEGINEVIEAENDDAGRGAPREGNEIVLQDHRAQFYPFPGETEVETCGAMITVTIFVCDQMDNVLFGSCEENIHIFVIIYFIFITYICPF